MSRLWLVLLLSFGAQPALALEPYTIADKMKGDPLGLHFEILEDRSNQLQFHEILQKDANAEFRPSQEQVPNFGLSRGARWVKFIIHNPLDHAVQVLLENKFTFTDTLEIYYQGSQGHWLKKEAGDQLPFKDRDISTRQAVFRLALEPGSHRFYARSFADGAHQLPLHIWTQDEFFSHNSQEYGLIGVLVGFHVVICLYNLFLFFSLRDKTYLYYVLYVTFNLFYQTSGLGLIQQTLSSLGIMESLSNRFMVITVDLIAITALLFSYHFLNIKQRLPLHFHRDRGDGSRESFHHSLRFRVVGYCHMPFECLDGHFRPDHGGHTDRKATLCARDLLYYRLGLLPPRRDGNHHQPYGASAHQ
jgi:hypothetical protein